LSRLYQISKEEQNSELLRVAGYLN